MSSMNRNKFPDIGGLEDTLPALRQTTEDLFEQFPMQHEAIFNEGSMDKGIVQHTGVTGIPAVAELSEGEEYPMDEMNPAFDKTFRAVKHGVIMPITEELMEDAVADVFERRPMQLARAMDEAIKITAADIFNDGFSENGPDGVPLFSKLHPLAYPGAGFSSNQLDVDSDLSLSALEDMVTLQREALDNAGKKIVLRPKQLIVGTKLEFLAHELTQSTQKPQASTASNLTEENAINAVRSLYGLSTVMLDYLTDEDAWFIASEKSQHNLWWYWRKRPVASADTEFKNDVALVKIKSRFVAGHSDWRGVSGTPGS